jgi:protein-S-isoprenylcysteine O-methyltransferase Ste14
MASPSITMLRFKQVAGILINTASFAILLFVPAGTLDWPRAWLFLAVVLVAATLGTLSISADLLDERYKPGLQKGQPLADKLLVTLFIVAFAATIMLAPVDVFRWQLLPPPPLVLSIVGLVLFAGAWSLLVVAMVANRFAIPVVRLQEERGQRVVDRGPYRFVRHPMYAAVLPLTVGMALWLGSTAAAIAAIVPTALIWVRAVVEERFLRAALPGYAEYMERIRYRVVPYVW